VRCEAPHITFDFRPLGPRADEALDNAELDFLIAPASAEFEAHASEVLFEDTFTRTVASGLGGTFDQILTALGQRTSQSFHPPLPAQHLAVDR
jgi:hypothetical protein